MHTTTDVDVRVELLARHAFNPSAFLALNEDVEQFGTPEIDGFIAFRRAGRRFAVQLGGPVAAEPDRGPLLDAFSGWARRQGRHIAAVQLLAPDVATYGAAGFCVNQFGSSYALDLAQFSLSGKRFVKLRNKIARATRAGTVVEEIDGDGLVDGRLDLVDRTWLRAKGQRTKEIQFMVGERRAATNHLRRIFGASVDGDTVAYATFVPAFGRWDGWLHDLSRRRPDAPPGVAELITSVAAERFRAEGAAHLHLGLTPFTGLDARHDAHGHASPLAGRIIRLIADHGEVIYPAHSQSAYKLKWHPQLIQPEFVAFSDRVRLTGVWQLLRLTQAI
jgi:lysylphosphatidylglycerol synthetase-like protein (DUF2156 family)